MERSWSDQQKAIFSWFESGSGNLVVRARAGTGKTTTIIKALDYASEESIMLCAFNKRIADELLGKLTNPNASAKTLHGIGFGIVRRYWSKIKVDDKRDATLAREVCGWDSPDAMVALVTKVAVRAKGSIPDPTQEDLEYVAELIDAVPDEEWERDGYDVEWVARYAMAQLERSKQYDGAVSFADMLYLPVAHNWIRPEYDLVVVDEAQDMSATQLVLAQRLCRGRLVVVGDDRQAIYGFRGADSDSINRMKRELNATELGLTITYRCPKRVVSMAARLVPDYRAAETAPEGEIRTISIKQITNEAQPGDFVLSRKNAPLASVCLALLRAGIRARIEGRDIGAGLVALVRRWKTRNSVPAFLEKLYSWQHKEIARASKRKDPDARLRTIEDTVETLQALSEGVASVAELEQRILSLFENTNGDRTSTVVCSSVHKAKGLEADRVFLLCDTLYPRGRKDLEEMNIEYVAVTRAKAELVLVTEKGA